MSADDNHQKRDAETNVVLGAFIVILGVAVLAGTGFADSVRAVMVNAIAGGILVVIGGGFVFAGSRARKKL